MAVSSTSFKKGNPGKPKGAINVPMKTVKETVLAVFNSLQDDPKYNLQKFAEAYPRDFYTIAAKLIPTEVKGDVQITAQIIGMQIVNDSNTAKNSE